MAKQSVPTTTTNNSTTDSPYPGPPGRAAPTATGLAPAAMAALATEPETPLLDLLKVVVAAAKHDPPWFLPSLFGRIPSWLPPYWRHSELNVLNHWEPLLSLRYLLAISVPSYSQAPNAVVRTLVPPVLRRLFWRPGFYYQQPDPYGSVTSYLDERWFFINGMATDPKVARMNTHLLSELFGRPISGIYNATNSIALDLIQCAIGKRYRINPDLEDLQTLTRSAFLATRAILGRVRDPSIKRVVIIAHSQGTIIAANLLRAIRTAIATADAIRREQPIKTPVDALEREACDRLLPPPSANLNEQQCHHHFAHLMGKMEFYLFANCADKFNYALRVETADGGSRGLPYLENFANEHDIVARLGVLSPLRTGPGTETETQGIISIDGPLYLHKGPEAWGHFLNAHYLHGILRHLEQPDKAANPYQPVAADQSPMPRLYGYYDGQRQGPPE